MRRMNAATRIVAEIAAFTLILPSYSDKNWSRMRLQSGSYASLLIRGMDREDETVPLLTKQIDKFSTVELVFNISKLG